MEVINCYGAVTVMINAKAQWRIGSTDYHKLNGKELTAKTRSQKGKILVLYDSDTLQLFDYLISWLWKVVGLKPLWKTQSYKEK